MDRHLLVAVEQFLSTGHPARQVHRLRGLTVSHRNADLESRSRFALSSEELDAFYQRLAQRLEVLRRDGLLGSAEAVLVSTCNRSELYVTAAPAADEYAHGNEDPADLLVEEALAIWADLRALTSQELVLLEPLAGPAAAQHLLEVATGLKSVVLGETQILQQLKEAYQRAYAHQLAGSALYTFFHAAFRAGRRGHAETAISQGNVSTASVGVELARQRLGGSLAEATVLLVGAGKVGRLTVEQLLAAGVRELRLVNRTLANLRPMLAAAHRHGHEASLAPLDEACAHLADADVMISAIHASEPYFTTARLAKPLAERCDAGRRSLVVVDLGVPPNVDPALATHEGLELIGVDDLRATSCDGLEKRKREVPKVRRVVAEEWQRLQDAPAALAREVVAALFRSFEGHNESEAKRQRKYGLPANEEELRAYGRRLIRRVLRPVVERTKRLDMQSTQDLEALKQLVDLFGLHPPDAER